MGKGSTQGGDTDFFSFANYFYFKRGEKMGVYGSDQEVSSLGKTGGRRRLVLLVGLGKSQLVDEEGGDFLEGKKLQLQIK